MSASVKRVKGYVVEKFVKAIFDCGQLNKHKVGAKRQLSPKPKQKCRQRRPTSACCGQIQLDARPLPRAAAQQKKKKQKKQNSKSNAWLEGVSHARRESCLDRRAEGNSK